MNWIFLIIGLLLMALSSFVMAYSEDRYEYSPYSLMIAVVLIGLVGVIFLVLSAVW